MRVLYVDCCIRKEESRTAQLADAFLRTLKRRYAKFTLQTVVLQDECISPLNLRMLRHREALAAADQWHDPVFRYARDFAEADLIVIAAPYWDLSFPALLKAYLEQVCVSGITFTYEETGSVGLCKAIALVYLTAAGGMINQNPFARGYLEALCGLWDIPEIYDVTAEGLDLAGAESTKIMQHACAEAEALADKI